MTLLPVRFTVRLNGVSRTRIDFFGFAIAAVGCFAYHPRWEESTREDCACFRRRIEVASPNEKSSADIHVQIDLGHCHHHTILLMREERA